MGHDIQMKARVAQRGLGMPRVDAVAWALGMPHQELAAEHGTAKKSRASWWARGKAGQRQVDGAARRTRTVRSFLIKDFKMLLCLPCSW